MSGAFQGRESAGSENAEASLLLATWTFEPAAGASGEVAADRGLDVERFGLPLGLFAAAQPRLGRRSPLSAVLADEHHTPPCLNDVAERPQMPSRPGLYPTPPPVLTRTGHGRRGAPTRLPSIAFIRIPACPCTVVFTGRSGLVLTGVVSYGCSACRPMSVAGTVPRRGRVGWVGGWRRRRRPGCAGGRGR